MVKWEKLPDFMKNESVRVYYDILSRKKVTLFLKRTFDMVVSFILLVVLSPIMAVLAVLIAMDSPGGVFFRQERITRYGKEFRIFKFRTMCKDAPNLGPSITSKDDPRITKMGKLIRKFRLDEFPQLINVFLGQMSFVGTRPEVKKYVESYTDEMKATLLLPAGVTSTASVAFRNEDQILKAQGDVDDAYKTVVLPAKMKINLDYIKRLSFFNDIKIMFITVVSVIK